MHFKYLFAFFFWYNEHHTIPTTNWLSYRETARFSYQTTTGLRMKSHFFRDLFLVFFQESMGKWKEKREKERGNKDETKTYNCKKQKKNDLKKFNEKIKWKIQRIVSFQFLIKLFAEMNSNVAL